MRLHHVFKCLLLLWVSLLSTNVAMLFGQAEWEGLAAQGSAGDFPVRGQWALANDFPPGTIIQVINVANNNKIKVRVIGRSNNNNYFLLLSSEAARNLGISAQFPARVQVAVASDIGRNFNNAVSNFVPEDLSPTSYQYQEPPPADVYTPSFDPNTTFSTTTLPPSAYTPQTAPDTVDPTEFTASDATDTVTDFFVTEEDIPSRETLGAKAHIDDTVLARAPEQVDHRRVSISTIKKPLGTRTIRSVTSELPNTQNAEIIDVPDATDIIIETDDAPNTESNESRAATPVTSPPVVSSSVVSAPFTSSLPAIQEDTPSPTPQDPINIATAPTPHLTSDAELPLVEPKIPQENRPQVGQPNPATVSAPTPVVSGIPHYTPTIPFPSQEQNAAEENQRTPQATSIASASPTHAPLQPPLSLLQETELTAQITDTDAPKPNTDAQDSNSFPKEPNIPLAPFVQEQQEAEAENVPLPEPTLAGTLDTEATYIQTGVFRDIITATRIADTLKQQGHKAFVHSQKSQPVQLHYVLVGPLSIDETGTLLLQIQSKGFSDAFSKKGSAL